MNELQIFKNEQFGQVRTIEENGKILFCGSDCAKALGYAKPRNAIATHCKGALKRGILTAGGNQEMSFIPEGDVYRLITHSKLPSAEKFESWVFDEVLPSIRKHSAYMTPEKIEEVLLNPDTIIRLAQELKAEREQNQKLTEENQVLEVKCDTLKTDIRKKEKKIEKLSKGQEFLNTFFKSKDLMSMQILAQTLCSEFPKFGRNKLIKFLKEQKIFTQNNTPYQQYINRKLFAVKNAYKNDSYGNVRVFPTPLATAKGAQFVYEAVKKAQSAHSM